MSTASRLEAMDTGGLQYEATGFARAMHDTGLVSPYHAVLLRFLLDQERRTCSARRSGCPSTGRELPAAATTSWCAA